MVEKHTGPEKAAILLISLGERLASKVLQQLEEKEIQTIGHYIAYLDNVSADTIDEVVEEFYKRVTSGGIGIVSGGMDYIRKVLSNITDPSRVNEIMNNIFSPGSEVSMGGGFEIIKHLDAKTISDFLRNEHPQTAAIILSHMESRHAATILRELPEKNRGEIVMRIATTDKVVHSVLKEIDEALEAEFRASGESGGVGVGRKIGGINTAAEILNQMDHTTEKGILAEVEEKNLDLAGEIKHLMFVFEDIINVDDRGIQTILKEISSEDLVMALKTASDTLKDKIFRNMSERAAIMVKEDLEVIGPVRLSDVEKVQQKIIQTAKRLGEEGKIMIRGGGEEFV
ncbi:MAG: flagellar motor switch protein FliG [Nitrospinae bacterium]|nr:flagellar motor switch protein FliG [Nitrospinota bacterium]